ncbi:Phospholipase_D-nuclease N-terminal [Daejeonella rubra]|uniref:Phospholipase_D-nuclease N-terminal n=1 Tax=Daejeonella rubra TaxID=990371 RepID=A0A1G9R4I5_9SPHI|nr:PLDc N-terminal domain-containing protein [Daejeonella rubra]SDM18154.1 Phospholipase_D-nuclease N-terminal [Daejeonella rubra]
MISEYTSGFGLWELIMIAFAVIALLLVIPFAIFDTMRSKDLSTTQKFLWILFILVAPYLGAVVYLFWGRKQKAI